MESRAAPKPLEEERKEGVPASPAAISRFEAVYRAEAGYVLHSLRRLGVHERDLEDVAHDVLVAVFRHLDDFDRGRPLRPWLFGFAYRFASDYRRLARHRYEAAPPVYEPAGTDPPADQQLDLERKRRLVLLALDRLDMDRRALLVMHDLDGHTMPEIARELSIPLNTAYSRLRLARRDFEAAIRDASPEEGGLR
jgi:RNA polymerase sigma-70 factor (ECF subfamily)